MRCRFGPNDPLLVGRRGFPYRGWPLAAGQAVLEREGRRVRLHKSGRATIGDSYRTFEDLPGSWFGMELLDYKKKFDYNQAKEFVTEAFEKLRSWTTPISKPFH